MKKQIAIIAAVCAAACCLGACDSTDEPEYPANEYEALNAMLDASYSEIVLTVTDTFDENTSLKSEYTITYSEDNVTVTYSVEKFAEIDGTLDDIYPYPKTTLTGEVIIEDGEVTLVDGVDIGLTAGIAKPQLTFNEKYFENVKLTGVRLKADVKNASAFLGSQLTCTDMRVEATFLEVFFNIQIIYTSEGGNEVEIQYVFKLWN